MTCKNTMSDPEQTDPVASEGASEGPSPEKTKQQEKAKISKVEILLHPTGDAPIIKKRKWSLEGNKRVAYIIDFIKKLIKSDPNESLFLYVNQAFAPSPDTEVGTLYECFGAEGKLVLHYCKTQAWG